MVYVGQNFLDDLNSKLKPNISVNSQKKLNKELAKEIRSKYIKNMCGIKKLAKEYGSSKKFDNGNITMAAILQGKVYR